MKLLVVIPTYNETLHLPHVVPRLLAAVPETDLPVVDDGSPDGTAEVARELGASHEGRVQVSERRSKSGRGGAVLAGLQAGLESGGYAEVVRTLAEVSGRRVRVEVDDSRAWRDDPQTLVGDTTRVRALGWRPERDLRQTLAHIVASRAP